ncbi:MAG: type 4a pilus biogenesis protein PilO [Planctomycetota bacterium]|nr:type 4a pilus biogenesis protein PilO [Planctomycetota bacterium]
MKNLLKNDMLVTVVSLAVVVFGYLLFIFVPGMNRQQVINEEILAAEENIENVPLRTAELNSLDDRIDERRDFLTKTDELMPANGDTHVIIGQVAQLAESAGLVVTRFEPLATDMHQAYRSVPFTLSFRGSYPSMLAFLRGLERRQRIFAISDFKLSLENERSAKVVEGEIKFAVYVRHEEFSGSAEKVARTKPRIADIRSREPRSPLRAN